MKAPLTIILLPLLAALWGCMRNTDEELKDVEDLQGAPTMEANEITMEVTDSGFLKYTFTTKRLVQLDNVEEPRVDFPSGLRFVSYKNRGRQTDSRIRCNNAKYYKTSKLWELNNDVEAETQKGDILNTEQLFWDTEGHRIYSKRFVRITTKNQVITGVGFESDENMSKYEIKKPGGEIEISE